MRHPFEPGRRITVPGAVLLLLVLSPLSRGRAQTDYANTDVGRPLRLPDALSIERNALAMQLSTLRHQHPSPGGADIGVTGALEYGVLPRTQLGIGGTLVRRDGVGGRRALTLAGIELSVLHQLIAETLQRPATALVGDLALPAGGEGPGTMRGSAGIVVTRSTSLGRVHAAAIHAVGGGESGDAALSVADLEQSA